MLIIITVYNNMEKGVSVLFRLPIVYTETDLGPLPHLIHTQHSAHLHCTRGKEMSLSRDLGHYYKLPKSDSNAVYLLSNSVYYLSTLSGNSLFPRKLYKVILACQQ